MLNRRGRRKRDFIRGGLGEVIKPVKGNTWI